MPDKTPVQHSYSYSRLREYVLSDLHSLTQCELLSRVRREGEPEQRHGRDEHAGHDQVEEVVERPPPDVDLERDVDVGLGAAVVLTEVAVAGNALVNRSC